MMTTKEKHEEKERCDVCRYYQEYEDLEPEDVESPEDFTGICRRYPPVIFAGLTPTSTNPDVSGQTGWCGEYMPKT